jgi:hypothetical protein
MASRTTTSDPSPWKTSGGPPLRERGIQLEEIVVRQPLVKAERARAGRRRSFDRADVPLAEMPALVAGLAQQLRDRDLLGAQ